MDEVTPDSTETQRLLQDLQSGQAEAFDRLFARHRAGLRQVIELRLDPRLRARVDPSDVVQETQLEVFQRLPDYLACRPMPFRLWLRKTAYERLGKIHRHHLHTARRAVQREVALPDRSSLVLAQQLLAGGSSPSQHLDRKEVVRRVRQALAQLADADREVLFMRNFEGLSHEEIACILEIEPATARKRYGRALLRLRALLFDSGFPEPKS